MLLPLGPVLLHDDHLRLLRQQRLVPPQAQDVAASEGGEGQVVVDGVVGADDDASALGDALFGDDPEEEEQERDPSTDLRRGQSIFDKSMDRDVHSFCLFTPI